MMIRRISLLLLVLALCLANGCAPRKGGKKPAGNEPEAITMRANPGFVQLLERQSLLYGARELSGQVSGSERSFIAPSTGSKVKVLLEAAGIWLDLRPNLLITSAHRPALAELVEGGIMDNLAASGIRGLYVAPMGESGAIWLDPRRSGPLSDDQSSFANAENVGSDKDFAMFSAKAEALGVQIGTDMLPAATGSGPDFLLALRNVRDFPGMYLMSEAPKEIWPLLPSAEEGRGVAIGSESLAALERSAAAESSAAGGAREGEKKLNLPVLSRDRLDSLSGGGWAVSSEVSGVDGVRRRWFYRYAHSPDRPVLNWDDPSGAARRVLSASVIRNTGMRRMALAGLRLEPFFGLDLAQGESGKPSLEPGPSAVRDISREIRRYGGWSVFMEPMPSGMSGALQEAGVDFIFDSFTSPAGEYALLSGDVEPLRAALQNSLASGVDQGRLMRGTPSGSVLYFAGQALEVKMEALLRKNSSWSVPFKKHRLEATPATLAAISAGLTQEKALSPEGRKEILKRHLLLVTFRAALPGMLVLSGQDLAGSLNVREGSGGAFSLGAPGTMTRQGTPRAPGVYPPAAAQAGAPDSFLGAIAALARIREITGIAVGRLEALPKTSGRNTVAAWSRLPAGGFLLAVANFSSSAIQESIALPGKAHVREIIDLTAGERTAPVDAGRISGLGIEPWQCRILLAR